MCTRLPLYRQHIKCRGYLRIRPQSVLHTLHYTCTVSACAPGHHEEDPSPSVPPSVIDLNASRTIPKIVQVLVISVCEYKYVRVEQDDLASRLL